MNMETVDIHTHVFAQLIRVRPADFHYRYKLYQMGCTHPGCTVTVMRSTRN